MTTDTKAVARFDLWGFDGFMEPQKKGKFVRFNDHARVVGQLGKDRNEWKQLADSHVEVIREIRTALAASRAEVEGLKKDAERYRWLKDNCEAVADEYATAGQLYFGTYLYGNIDSAIDAAMEKGNV